MGKVTEKAAPVCEMLRNATATEGPTLQHRSRVDDEAVDAPILPRSPKLAAKMARPVDRMNSTMSSSSPSPSFSVSPSEASASSRSSASSSGRPRVTPGTTSTGKKRSLGHHHTVDTAAINNTPHGSQQGAKRSRVELPSHRQTAHMCDRLFAVTCAQMRGRTLEYKVRENELDEELQEQEEEERELQREIKRLMREFKAHDPEAAAAFKQQRGMEERWLKREPREAEETQSAAAPATEEAVAPTDLLLPGQILEREKAIHATIRQRDARVKELAASLPRLRELASGQAKSSAWA